VLDKQLSLIRLQLAERTLSVSDGLLFSLRALRGKISENRLTWLNRELLGYRPEDLESLAESEPRKNSFSKIVLLWAPSKKSPEVLQEAPIYRFLKGTWGRMDDYGNLDKTPESQQIDKSIFCNIGIQQLEAQLSEMENPLEGLFSMSYDRATGSEFYCYSSELVRIQDAVRDKLLQFIDDVIEELRLSPTGEGS
jgi:hypothetical protein